VIEYVGHLIRPAIEDVRWGFYQAAQMEDYIFT
jgi:hypothetical protein